jgi:hypothetical protein
VKILLCPGQVVKMWDRETGKPYTSIEATADFNDLCLYKQSGLLFLANEQPKMQVDKSDLATYHMFQHIIKGFYGTVSIE